MHPALILTLPPSSRSATSPLPPPPSPLPPPPSPRHLPLPLTPPPPPHQVKFSLHKPLQAAAETGAYQRVVFKFRYDNYELLRRLQNRVMVNNGKVLGFATDNPGMLAKTLATVQLTDAQAKDSSLDLITGFELIDPGFRLMILEGLARGAMRELIGDNPRQAVNNADLTILYHPDVTFAERLYTAFNAVVFKVKLSDSLKNIIYSPDVYLLPKFASCAAAIMRVAEVSRAKRMIRLRDLKLFPSALQVMKLDKKFGSVLTNRDIDGTENARARKVEGTVEGGGGGLAASAASPTKKAATAGSSSAAAAAPSSPREPPPNANALGLVDTKGPPPCPPPFPSICPPSPHTHTYTRSHARGGKTRACARAAAGLDHPDANEQLGLRGASAAAGAEEETGLCVGQYHEGAVEG